VTGERTPTARLEAGWHQDEVSSGGHEVSEGGRELHHTFDPPGEADVERTDLTLKLGLASTQDDDLYARVCVCVCVCGSVCVCVCVRVSASPCLIYRAAL
jgi:hypothetical protein